MAGWRTDKKLSKKIAKMFGGIKKVKASRRAHIKSGEATSKLYKRNTNKL
jgi:phage protein D